MVLFFLGIGKAPGCFDGESEATRRRGAGHAFQGYPTRLSAMGTFRLRGPHAQWATRNLVPVQLWACVVLVAARSFAEGSDDILPRRVGGSPHLYGNSYPIYLTPPEPALSYVEGEARDWHSSCYSGARRNSECL